MLPEVGNYRVCCHWRIGKHKTKKIKKQLTWLTSEEFFTGIFSSISLLHKYDCYFIFHLYIISLYKILTLSHLISLIWINTTYLIIFYLSLYSCNLFFYLMAYYLKQKKLLTWKCQEPIKTEPAPSILILWVNPLPFLS